MSIKHISNIILIICLIIFIACFIQFILKLMDFKKQFLEAKNSLDIVNEKATKAINTSNLILTECRNKLIEIKKMIPWLFLLLAFKKHYQEAKEKDEPRIRYSLNKTAKDAIYINNL